MDLRLSNHTDQEITLQTGHIVPANGYLDIEARVADRAEIDPWFAGQLRRGNLSLSEVEGLAAPEPVTRETVARMKKTDLQEYLAAHGAPTDGTADDLRDRLTSLMFVDL